MKEYLIRCFKLGKYISLLAIYAVTLLVTNVDLQTFFCWALMLVMHNIEAIIARNHMGKPLVLVFTRTTFQFLLISTFIVTYTTNIDILWTFLTTQKPFWLLVLYSICLYSNLIIQYFPTI